jgi:uncharacterized protein YbbC (DUF1343 family)
MDSLLLPGLDALRVGLPEIHAVLRGRKIGLLTNHTGRARDDTSTLDVLRDLGLNVVALFSPEHGFSGTREGFIESSTHNTLPVHSLYGATRRPTREMLDDIEVLVCDLQDVGARFYTYATTLAFCMEECAPRSIAVVVLDRPNPIGGICVEGPLVEDAHRSFIGHLDVPIRHGMTLGELALLHKRNASLDIELHIAQVLGWQRGMLWPETGLKWPVPSPNLPDWISAAWYPGTCLLEFSGVSVGRGTDAPFQIIGAPWMESPRVLDAMELWPEEMRANFSAQAIQFTPTRGEHEGVLCHGIRLQMTQGESRIPSQVVPLGLCLLSTLHATHRDDFQLEKCLTLLGSSKVLDLLRSGDVAAAIEICAQDASTFGKSRTNSLIYPTE